MVASYETLFKEMGLDLEKVEAEAKALCEATIARHKELGLPSIFPNTLTLPKNVRIADYGPTSRTYRVDRRDSDRGFKSYQLIVVQTFCLEKDGQLWQHVSVSRKGEVPSYDDMCFAKKYFIGPDKLALELHVPEDEHVNVHPNTLHLWHCMESRPTPDFRKFGQV